MPPLVPKKPRVLLSQGRTARGTSMTVTAGSLGLKAHKPRGRVAEAKACLLKANLQINSSRNLKAEIRADVIQAVKRLYRLVKEAEEDKPPTSSSTGNIGAAIKEQTARQRQEDKELESILAKKIEEHGEMLRENTEGKGLTRKLQKANRRRMQV